MENNKNKVIPMVLIGNKSDLRELNADSIDYDSGLEYARNLSEWSNIEIPYVETSAKDGSNVNEAFVNLLGNIESHHENSKA